MDLIKRKIWLEDGISRANDVTYGTMTASTFYTNIFLTQNYDNMGMYTDIGYDNGPVDYGVLIQKLSASGFTFPFMSGIVPPSVILTGFTSCTRVDYATVDDWYSYGMDISATTDTRLNELKTYNVTTPFINGFDINSETYVNYSGGTVNGVDRVVQYDPLNGSTYVFDANNDSSIGTELQNTGLRYIDNGNYTSGVTESNLYFKGEGWNDTNTSLSAITKEEYLMGILYPPEVFSDVFIDRGATTVMEKHLRLSEVEGVEHLTKYGNGFYNIISE